MESYVIYTKSSLPQLSFPQPSEEFDKHTAQLHSIGLDEGRKVGNLEDDDGLVTSSFLFDWVAFSMHGPGIEVLT